MPPSPRASAMRPVRTISTNPYGSSSSRNASTFAGGPLTSIVTVLRATSITRARKISDSSSTWNRSSGLVCTLISASSRSTDDDSSNSVTLMTDTSLFSCFVTCSSGLAVTSTTIVMRDMPARSVVPTASEWMLNPRRANRLETCVSTPGWSSTRTDTVCRLMRPVLPPGRPRASRTRARG